MQVSDAARVSNVAPCHLAPSFLQAGSPSRKLSSFLHCLSAVLAAILKLHSSILSFPSALLIIFTSSLWLLRELLLPAMLHRLPLCPSPRYQAMYEEVAVMVKESLWSMAPRRQRVLHQPVPFRVCSRRPQSLVISISSPLDLNDACLDLGPDCSPQDNDLAPSTPRSPPHFVTKGRHTFEDQGGIMDLDTHPQALASRLETSVVPI